MPGPQVCQRETSIGLLDVDCTWGDAAWSNERQCYWTLSPRQSPAPFGANPSGAWYNCIPIGCPSTGCTIDTIWLNNPPPGITILSPAQAAQRLVTSFTLTGIDIGMAPHPNPQWGHRRSYVGVPIWMWAANQTPLNWGTHTETATLGGQTITAEARVAHVSWNMGDGTTITCGGPGTPYTTAHGLTMSPTCGHRYARTSTTQPDGMYTVTATSTWHINWTGGGQTGTITIETTSTTHLEIRQLQTVNIPNPNTPDDPNT